MVRELIFKILIGRFSEWVSELYLMQLDAWVRRPELDWLLLLRDCFKMQLVMYSYNSRKTSDCEDLLVCQHLTFLDYQSAKWLKLYIIDIVVHGREYECVNQFGHLFFYIL